MINRQYGIGVIFALLGLSDSLDLHAYEASDLPELRKSVHAACPRVWESTYSRLVTLNGDRITEPLGEFYVAGKDIWHSVPTDKSRYITFALNKLVTRGNELTIDYASSDGAVITACSNARADLIGTVIQSRNDETGAFSEQYIKQLVKDDDSDGVFNLVDDCPDDFSQLCIGTSVDVCPDTQVGDSVDPDGVWRGCSISQKDTDYDQVTDDLDTRCPNTPQGESVDTEGEWLGCSISEKDTDGDGVFDDVDVCVGTVPDVLVGSNGCPADSDEDGIFDYEDPYPFQSDTQCFP